LQLPQLTTKL
jgi:hypothetical protein